MQTAKFFETLCVCKGLKKSRGGKGEAEQGQGTRQVNTGSSDACGLGSDGAEPSKRPHSQPGGSKGKGQTGLGSNLALLSAGLGTWGRPPDLGLHLPFCESRMTAAASQRGCGAVQGGLQHREDCSTALV